MTTAPFRVLPARIIPGSEGQVLKTTGGATVWGSAGAQGSQGATGTQGPQGTQGTQGVQGAQGTQGTQGVQGVVPTRTVMPISYLGTASTAASLTILNTDGSPRVSRASAGTTGSDGWIYTTVTGTALVGGDFIARWDEGDALVYTEELVVVASGAAGPQGSQGGAGTTGTQGPQGTTGTQGTQGATGTQGPQGPGVGAQGPQGATGVQGPQGAQGFQGATGAGVQGATGSQGPQGTQGTQGPQGATGSGSQGAQGSQGATGPAGLAAGTVGGPPLMIIRTSDGTGITSSTTGNTLTSDTQLTFSVTASDTWFVEAFLVLSGSDTTHDHKVAFLTPSGWTGYWGALSVLNTTTNAWGPNTAATTPITFIAPGTAIAGGSVSGIYPASYAAVLVGDGVHTGSITLQIAQNTSSAGALLIKAGSFLRAARMA